MNDMFLLLFISLISNGISLIKSEYKAYKSAFHIDLTGQQNVSHLQNAELSITLQPDDIVENDEPHILFTRENNSILAEAIKHSLNKKINTMNSSNNDSNTRLQVSPSERRFNQFSSSKSSSIDSNFEKSLEYPGIIFFKRVYGNETFNSANATDDSIKLTTFSLKEECNETCHFVFNPSNKLQTIDELVTDIIDYQKGICEYHMKNEKKYYYDYPSNGNSSDTSNPLDSYLTNVFNCNLTENGLLKLTCSNISLYEVSGYIPAETIEIDISDSPLKIATKPLFPHLTNLTSLRLHNNRHRYITRAFTGLRSLESLDLSKNDIQVLFRKAFDFTPNLKLLNLSMNAIISMHTIAIPLGNLKYFESLIVDNNNIKRILKSELEPLRNTRLEKFSLFSSTLNTIEKGAFAHLPFLKVLELSLNYMDQDALTNITSSIPSSIEYFGVRALVGLNLFPVESLFSLQNRSLFRLDLSSNFFPNLPKLPANLSFKSLWLSHCSLNIIEIGAFDNLPNLEELVLSYNELTTHPASYSSMNNLRILILKKQTSRYNTKFSLPDFAFENSSRLEILDLSNVLIDNTLSRYSFHGLKKLRVLDLSQCKIQGIEDNAFETLSSLEILNLNANKLRYINDFTLMGLQNLSNLYLSSNSLRFLLPVYPLKALPLLNSLHLHNNEIILFPKGFFDYNVNLKVLILTNNALLPWSTKVFKKNSSLKILGLSGNQIDRVTSAMMSDFKKVSEFLDLSRNPFNCSMCGMEELQYFLKFSNLTFGVPLAGASWDPTIFCAEPSFLRGQPFLDVEMTLECTEMEEVVLNLFSLVLIVIIFLFVTIGLYMCYFFRWYLRYWIFHMKAKVKEKMRQDIENEHRYAFDAFVSYNSHDNFWIVKHLVPSLEQKDPKYKFCIHERDFQLGRLITDNILEAIEASRNVILILTEEFIKSEWCMFELHMAQHRLFDDTRDCLILVKLKDIDKKFYTKNLMYLEKTRNCLIWTEDKTGQKLFWEKMRRALGDPLRGSFSTEICI